MRPTDEEFGKIRGNKGSHLPCPHLAVTRALGHNLKGILHTPEVTVRKLTDADIGLVLVTDGVYQCLENRLVLLALIWSSC